MSTRSISTEVYGWLSSVLGAGVKIVPEYIEQTLDIPYFATYSVSGVLPQVFTGQQNFGLLQPTVIISIYGRDYDETVTLTETFEREHGKQKILSTSLYAMINMEGPVGGIRFDDASRVYQASYTVELYCAGATI